MGGGYAARLFILFSFPCSADHERDWPPCKVVFFGLATNTLNVRNSNNNYYCSVFKENLSASRPSEHPTQGGGNVKTLRRDHRLQRQNIFMAFKRVSQW